MVVYKDRGKYYERKILELENLRIRQETRFSLYLLYYSVYIYWITIRFSVINMRRAVCLFDCCCCNLVWCCFFFIIWMAKIDWHQLTKGWCLCAPCAISDACSFCYKRLGCVPQLISNRKEVESLSRRQEVSYGNSLRSTWWRYSIQIGTYVCIKHHETLGWSCWIPQKLLRNIASGSNNGGIAYAPFKFQGPWIVLRLNHFLTS